MDCLLFEHDDDNNSDELNEEVASGEIYEFAENLSSCLNISEHDTENYLGVADNEDNCVSILSDGSDSDTESIDEMCWSAEYSEG